jgi:putative membrane protein
VPVLAIWTAVLGLKDRRLAHRRLAWWTFPIWLYVSVTGVIVYIMLYHFYPNVS